MCCREGVDTDGGSASYRSAQTVSSSFIFPLGWGGGGERERSSEGPLPGGGVAETDRGGLQFCKVSCFCCDKGPIRMPPLFPNGEMWGCLRRGSDGILGVIAAWGG